MDETYLHRLSRPYRVTASAARPPQTEHPGAADAGPGSAPRRPDDALRRRPATTACEVCGRTLLAGEQAREIVLGERLVAACPLCVAQAQHALRAHAA